MKRIGKRARLDEFQPINMHRFAQGWNDCRSEPEACCLAQTIFHARYGTNLPDNVDVLPELTPCGDVGLVSAYLQALANEGTSSVLVISHLPLVGYLVSELCPGETPPMFTTSAIASVTLDESGKGVYNWQMSPCNLRMPKAI